MNRMQYHHFAIHEHTRGNWSIPLVLAKKVLLGEREAISFTTLSQDPRQQTDVANENAEVFQRLKTGYENWFQDVSSTRPNNYAPPRIVIGTEHELRSVLTRQDWRHVQGKPWAGNSNGFWLLEAPQAAGYELELAFSSDHPAGTATITAGTLTKQLDISAGQRNGHRTGINLPKGKIKLAVDVVFDGKAQGPHQVILTRR